MSSDTDNSSDSEEEEEAFDSTEIERDNNWESERRIIMNNQLPNVSRAAYELAYANFLQWLHQHGKTKVDETALIIYFQELKTVKKYQASTMWSTWSKLRATLKLRNSININNYDDLKLFMRNNGKGHKPKQSATFTWSQIIDFLNSSDVQTCLAQQVLNYFS